MISDKYTLVEGGLTIDTKLSHDDEERYPLFIDATAVKRSPDDATRDANARRILELLQESGIGYGGGEEDPRERDLMIRIGFQNYGYGIFNLEADFVWPAVSDEEAADIATEAMRRMAQDVGLYKHATDAELASMVYARVNRASGITLETNHEGSCSMETNGSRYRPGSERVKLEAHNLYRHEMQLICIKGIIALVKAR